MPIVPESDLQHVFDKLISATSSNAPARKTAVRWFNRLYYDVRSWNDGFIKFLRTYPGFKNSNNSSEYRLFAEKLEEYRDSLQERYGTVKGDLCTSLKILSARYPRDFSWLYKEDEDLYHEIRSLIDDSYATEMQIIRVAYTVANFIYDISSDEDWHTEHHEEIVDRICEYEESSKEAVSNLQQTADSVGIHLLDITEYEAAINNEGSANPNVMVIGEVTMSQDNIHIENVVGPVNIKARLDRVNQVVKNAPTVEEPHKVELSNLVDELKQSLEVVAAQAPEDSERVIQAAEMVAAEVSKKNPSKSFLAITTEGLKEAAKAVEAITPSVLSVATKIAKFVAGII